MSVLGLKSIIKTPHTAAVIKPVYSMRSVFQIDMAVRESSDDKEYKLLSW